MFYTELVIFLQDFLQLNFKTMKLQCFLHFLFPLIVISLKTDLIR